MILKFKVLSGTSQLSGRRIQIEHTYLLIPQVVEGNKEGVGWVFIIVYIG